MRGGPMISAQSHMKRPTRAEPGWEGSSRAGWDWFVWVWVWVSAGTRRSRVICEEDGSETDLGALCRCPYWCHVSKLVMRGGVSGAVHSLLDCHATPPMTACLWLANTVSILWALKCNLSSSTNFLPLRGDQMFLPENIWFFGAQGFEWEWWSPSVSSILQGSKVFPLDINWVQCGKETP